MTNRHEGECPLSYERENACTCDPKRHFTHTKCWESADELEAEVEAWRSRYQTLEWEIGKILAEHWDWKAGRSLLARVRALITKEHR